MAFRQIVQILIAGVAVSTANLQAESVEQSQSALVMIEYQNEWVSEKGNLRNLLVEDKEPFKSAINHSKSLLTAAREQGVSIIHVTLKPDAQYRIFGDADLVLER